MKDIYVNTISSEVRQLSRRFASSKLCNKSYAMLFVHVNTSISHLIKIAHTLSIIMSIFSQVHNSELVGCLTSSYY